MTDRRPRLDPAHPPAGRAARAYAALVDRLRWLVIVFWAATLGLLLWLAPPFGAGGDEITSIIPVGSPALQAEYRAVQEFGYPLTSRTLVVQRDPQGLSPFTEAASVLEAASVNQGSQPYPLLGALPVTNSVPLVPGARENGTTLLTYLFMTPSASLSSQYAAARQYVQTHLDHPGDAVVGIAGSIPARDRQATLVARYLPLLEGLTVLAILLLVGLNFRSVAAPLIALAASGVAFGVTARVAGIVGAALGLSVPAELEPLLVALLLGIVTDYTVFYVSALKIGLDSARDRRRAVRFAIASFTPIILVAGLTVAAGTGSLVVAESGFLRAIGPGLALAVLIGLGVSVTLIPALLAVLRRGTFWPRKPGPDAGRPGEMAGPGTAQLIPPTTGNSLVALLIRPAIAAAVLVGCLALLVLAASPLRHLELGVGFTRSLPASDPVFTASQAAAEGFAPGITSPTTVLVEGSGVTAQRDALITLQAAIASRPGVAGVFGPAQAAALEPLQQALPERLGVVLARSGNAARMVVVLDSDPLEARAIDTIANLRATMPRLVEDSGLRGVKVSLAGDTALAEGLVSGTTADLWRVTLAALAVNLLLLIVFLRAVVAPLYLLASSVLALAASLGVTVWIFQDRLGNEGLTFYVPFAAAVLLVSLGSDYNIFGVGHVWEEARRRPLREAVAVALPQSTRAIGAAAITLVVSFGMLALIPLRPFRELAVTLALGIVIDAVLVRSVLVPCLLTLVGPASAWPSHQFRDRAAPPPRSSKRRRPHEPDARASEGLSPPGPGTASAREGERSFGTSSDQDGPS